MAIPQYEQQVTPDATQATTPEELHPLAAAFGGDIGKALEASSEQVSNRIEQLSQHMALMNYYRGQAAVADKVLEVKSKQDDFLLSQEPKEITRTPQTLNPSDTTLSSGAPPSGILPLPSGKTFTAPAGLLQRTGYAADSITDEYHQWAAQASKQATDEMRADGYGERNIRSLKMHLDADFASNARHIAGYEAQQVNNAQITTFTTLMQKTADSGSFATDSQSLGLKIDAINKTGADLSLSQHLFKNPDGSITDAHTNTVNTYVGQALDNSNMTNLKTNNGDPTQAQANIDRLHTDGRITDEQYDIAQKHLNIASKAMISQNETNSKIQDVNVTMDAFNKLGQGKFDISNQNIIDDYASKNPKLGNALQTVAETKGQYMPPRTDVQHREYQKNVTDMINSSSQEQLSGYMMKTISDKGFSQTDMNIWVNALLNHGKTLPVIDGQQNSPITQDMASSAFNALSTWADKANLKPEEKTDLINHYLEGMSKNGAPKDNYDKAIQNHMISAYPALATKEPENIPTEIDGKSQGFNKAVNFAKGTEQEKAKKFPDRRLIAQAAKETPGEAEEDQFGKING